MVSINKLITRGLGISKPQISPRKLTTFYFSDKEAISKHIVGELLTSDIPDINTIKIDIGEDVTGIGNYAFAGCQNLDQITMLNPENITSIGEGAFQDNQNFRFIGNYSQKPAAVRNELIALPPSITEIKNNTFKNCSRIGGLAGNPYLGQLVIFPEQLTSIGDEAFYNCGSISTIILPQATEKIGDMTFMNMKNLTTLELSSSLKSIGYKSFYNSFSGVNRSECVLEIPNSVQSLGKEAFANCQFLNIIKIGSGIRDIPDYAFFTQRGSNNRKKLIFLGESITNIGYRAFPSELTYLHIPDSIQTISKYAFEGIYEDLTIYVNSQRVKQLVIDSGFNGEIIIEDKINPQDTIVYYLDQGIGGRIQKTIISDTTIKNNYSINENAVALIVGSKVTSIEDNSFRFSNIQYVDLTNASNLTSIGNNAFNNSKLVSINLHLANNLTTIGSNAFNHCSNLRFISLPSSVTSIGNDAFDSYNYQTFNIPNKELKELLINSGIKFGDIGNSLGNPIIKN